MADRDIIESTFEPLEKEELELPEEAASSPEAGSNLIPITPRLALAVLERMRAGDDIKTIKRTVKNAQGKKLSWAQIRLIFAERRRIYRAKTAPIEPIEPIEPREAVKTR